MSPLVLRFDPSGLGQCLYSELIDLAAIGSLELRRASTIEFNQEQQQWEVRATNDDLLFSNKSRAVCLVWEHQHIGIQCDNESSITSGRDIRGSTWSRPKNKGSKPN